MLRKEDPPMTRFVAVELAKDHYFNINAARRDLGYEPKTGMAEALEKRSPIYANAASLRNIVSTS